MHVNIEKAAAWLGLAMFGAFIVMFWAIARLIPPMNPAASAAEIARIYSEHGLRIRIGMAMMILLASLYAPFLALVSRQVRRIEGYWGVMSITQIMLSVTFPLGFMLCALFAVLAGYRPERNPDVTQALNDMFWFIFVGFVGPLTLQVVILAFAVFLDRREKPSFPRWYGYFNIWYAILGVPGSAIYLFKTGPLAWNGLFAFWVPLAAFSIWFIVTTLLLVKSVDVEAERAANAAERRWEQPA